MRFYKRLWNEKRGDEYSLWGCSEWFFETTEDGTVVRQMEIYDNGRVLQYDAYHDKDKFGGLADQPLDHSEFSPFSISRDEFEAAWNSHRMSSCTPRPEA